jgi:hypothetical protein
MQGQESSAGEGINSYSIILKKMEKSRKKLQKTLDKIDLFPYILLHDRPATMFFYRNASTHRSASRIS